MATEGVPARVLTPPEVADQLRVSPDKVLTWIRSGELRAVNVVKRVGGRPRYRVSVDDLAAFMERRAVVPEVKVARRRKRRDPHVIEFFR
jgi:excisionase family DNA binding protein